MTMEACQSDLLGRREFLWRLGGELGGIAVAQMLGRDGLLAATTGPRPDLDGGLHHRPKVRRIVQLFMNGGASQCDTFDYKPELIKRHGQTFDPGSRVEAVTSVPGKVLKSPWTWKQYGESGRWVSSVFPHVATIVDDLAFLMAMASKTNVHGPASYMQNTGFVTPGFPSMGSWISYGLGSLNDNLPTFVVLPDSRGLPYNNSGNFSSAFLPVAHQGTIIKATAPVPIADLFPPESARYITPAAEAEGRALLKTLNRNHMTRSPGDSRLEARLSSYEMAARMQLSAPEVLNLAGESRATRALYGLDDKATDEFGRNCLTARRLLERGVRFVQVWSGAGGPTGNWDNHNDVDKALASIALSTDKPVAGLVKDLKARGLFEDTLVIWTTEFGRMPFSQGSLGRDHNGGTFVSWLAGAGIEGGLAFGESDEWSWKARQPTYCYDLHATILHLLGIDHERLTFRHNGSDRRLTDVHGRVITEILRSPSPNA
ncbi:Protein of unknown function [Singulisphaera sp. GP187]|nr:Protein of unknown function [Singulisphaera sp. GP187]